MVTTKQPQPERLRDWYPYYAGFSNAFVAATLDRHFQDTRTLLDPWNGSGTTSVVAAGRGLAVVGLDVNPAVTLIARARLTPVAVGDSLLPMADEIVTAASRGTHVPWRDDPLGRWLRAPAVETIRRLQRAINVVLIGQRGLEEELRYTPEAASDSMPVLGAFYYAALFAAVRDLLGPFRGTNPTWLRFPVSSSHRLSPGPQRIRDAFRSRVGYLGSRLTVANEAATSMTSVRTMSVLDLAEVDSYDACLTSPPYATRVDYVRSSLAELAVMGLATSQLDALRLATTGSPQTRGAPAVDAPTCSTARDVTARVTSHPSHGSANYYGPWIRRYLADLERSLTRIERSVSSTGRIGLVVQDSFYKKIHIDLQQIVTETLTGRGRRLLAREDHAVSHLFSRINPAAKRHLADRTHCESLLVFS